MENFVFATNLNVVMGCVFKEIRTKFGIEQTVISNALDIPVSTISKIESGSMNLTAEYIFMLCSFYGVKASYFLEVVERCIDYLQMNKKVFVYNEKAVKDQKGEKVLVKISNKSSSNVGLAGSVAAFAATAAILPLPLSLAAMGFSVAKSLMLNKAMKDTDKEKVIVEKKDDISTIELTALPPKTIATSLEEVFNELDLKLGKI